MAGDIYGVSVFGAVSAQSAGVSRSPSFCFESERSLGFYRSAASTIALSYGTLSLPGGLVAADDSTFSGSFTVADSGYTGTPLKAMSFTTCVVPAHVVQGSASSFTVFAIPFPPFFVVRFVIRHLLFRSPAGPVRALRLEVHQGTTPG